METVFDNTEEKQLYPGIRVEDPTDPKGYGFVIHISDVDGDYSDALQRAVMINPDVTVLYKDGSKLTFNTMVKGGYHFAQEEFEFVCEDLEVCGMGNELLKFTYVNWKEEKHEYVIEPESLEYKEIRLDENTSNNGWHHVLHGYVVTRDGDARVDMGDNRRRTFILAKIENLEEMNR